jgi:hypothetical protein
MKEKLKLFYQIYKPLLKGLIAFFGFVANCGDGNLYLQVVRGEETWEHLHHGGGAVCIAFRPKAQVEEAFEVECEPNNVKWHEGK